MAADRFHAKPFDEGTLTKLEIFELYTREWLPVFLSQLPPRWDEIHLFDFFSGPGQSPTGQPGSPLRLLSQVRTAASHPAWRDVKVHLHFFDADPECVATLRAHLTVPGVVPDGVDHEAEVLAFEAAFQRSLPILQRERAAKLVLILDYYRGLLPRAADYFLAPFSIKKNANIYGLIFGSGHPLGMDKFLQVAWKKDEIAGEADFDILGDRTAGLLTPTKLGGFEQELEDGLRTGSIRFAARRGHSMCVLGPAGSGLRRTTPHRQKDHDVDG
ncbi:MAG TPA: three-Cys-motif partner protein TcmP [Vicinamibacterales bacterium]|nr:three-Cys-motif partner protein TcmP [Vicinamibacterales bacterium]